VPKTRRRECPTNLPNSRKLFKSFFLSKDLKGIFKTFYLWRKKLNLRVTSQQFAASIYLSPFFLISKQVCRIMSIALRDVSLTFQLTSLLIFPSYEREILHFRQQLKRCPSTSTNLINNIKALTATRRLHLHRIIVFQFTQCFMSSIYMHRSQKRKKILTT